MGLSYLKGNLHTINNQNKNNSTMSMRRLTVILKHHLPDVCPGCQTFEGKIKPCRECLPIFSFFWNQGALHWKKTIQTMDMHSLRQPVSDPLLRFLQAMWIFFIFTLASTYVFSSYYKKRKGENNV